MQQIKALLLLVLAPALMGSRPLGDGPEVYVRGGAGLAKSGTHVELNQGSLGCCYNTTLQFGKIGFQAPITSSAWGVVAEGSAFREKGKVSYAPDGAGLVRGVYQGDTFAAELGVAYLHMELGDFPLPSGAIRWAPQERLYFFVDFLGEADLIPSSLVRLGTGYSSKALRGALSLGAAASASIHFEVDYRVLPRFWLGVGGTGMLPRERYLGWATFSQASFEF